MESNRSGSRSRQRTTLFPAAPATRPLGNGSPTTKTSTAIAIGSLLLACSAQTEDPLALEASDALETVQGDMLPQVDLTTEPRASQQIIEFELGISEDGEDIVLDWSARADAISYEVWTSPEPWFSPEDESAQLLASGITETTYVHIEANDLEDRYYRVRVEGDPEEVSSTAGKVVTELFGGYTKIGSCLDSEVDDAQALLSELGASPLSLHAWNADAQEWTNVWAEHAYPLPIPIGSAVSVFHEEGVPVVPSHLTTVGRVPENGEVIVALVPGDNVVTMLASRPDLGTAADVLASVDHATRVGRWDRVAQAMHWYPEDGDFDVSPCDPLHVEVDEVSAWPPLTEHQTVGPDGGVISAYSGTVQLEVPAGALSEPTDIRITPYGYTVEEGQIPTFAIEPHDLVFDTPVTLTIRYRPGFVPIDADESLVDLLHIPTDGAWHLLGASNDLEAGTLTATIDSFSYFGVARLCSHVEPASVEISPNNPITYTGQILPLGAVPFNIFGLELPTRDTNWWSSNNGVAAPSSGTPLSAVFASSVGVAQITAEVASCAEVPVSVGLFVDVGLGLLSGGPLFGELRGFVQRLVRRLDIWPFIDVQFPIPVRGSTFVTVQDPTCADVSCPEDATVCTTSCSGGVCGQYPIHEGGQCEDEGGPFGFCTADVCSGGTCTHPADPVCLFVLCLWSGICAL